MSDTNNQDNNRFEEIDRYLQGQMDAREQASFENEMANNPSLREEVEKGRNFLLAMDTLDQDELREELQKTNQVIHNVRQTTEVDYEAASDDDEQNATPIRSINTVVRNIAAAAAVLLVLLIPLYFLLLQKPAPHKLADQYYETYPNTLTNTTRSASDSNQQLQGIMSLYEKGDYNKALNQSSHYLEDHPQKYELRFYRGIMYIEQDNYRKAIEELEKVRAQNNSYQTQAEWYLALAHLARQQPEQARNFLRKLAQEPSDYQQKAEELISELDE